MGEPISLLGNARGFARDFPRDQMPKGMLWDCVDFVPSLIEATLTARGQWIWGSDVAGGDFESGIVAPFVSGSQLLGQALNGHLYRVDQNTNALTDLGAFIRCKQNPVMFAKRTVWFDRDGLVVPKLVDSGGVPVAMPGTAPKSRYGAIWGHYLVSDGGPGSEHIVWFSQPSDPTLAYDPNSFVASALPITGIGSVRSVVLVFHAGLVERIRGTSPQAGSDEGDLVIEPLFQRIGCGDARSIAYWNDNCIFADEHGVHMTDGAVVRDLTTQGGLSSYWRQLYRQQQSVVGTVFLDYYLVTVKAVAGPAVTFTTLVCDLNRRQWFRFSNIDALCYIAAGAGVEMERVWAGIDSTSRLGRIGPCFFPSLVTHQDGNGEYVQPVVETPWYRLGQEGRKRIRFAYLSYDLQTDDPSPNAIKVVALSDPRTDPVFGVSGSQREVYLPETQTYALSSETEGYKRYRVPVQFNAYGAAFAMNVEVPFLHLRIYDFAIEAGAMERSRV